MQYIIEKVSNNPPKEWTGGFGPMVTYKVIFQGGPDVIEINKKPDSVPPKAGDTLDGTIEGTEYGKRFKAVSKQYGQYGAQSKQSAPSTSSYQPRDDNAIKAQFAIKAAIQFASMSNLPSNFTDIEDYAKAIYNMVDRVKGAITTSDDGFPQHDVPPEDLNEDGSFGKRYDDDF